MSAPAVPPQPLPSAGVSHFSALLDEDLWSWSDDLVALLGHRQHPILVTTELFLHHVLPADRPAVSALLEEATDHPCSALVRARTTRGDDLFLHLTARPRPRVPGAPDWLSAGIEGSVVVVDPPGRAPAPAGGDWSFEHARGVVMYAFDLGTDAATALLGHYARARRVEVEELSRDLVRAVERVPRHQVTRGLVATVLAAESVGADVPPGARRPSAQEQPTG